MSLRDADLERRSFIPVDIEEVEDIEDDSSYVMVQSFSREGEMVPFTCQIERKDIESIRSRKRKLVPKLSVTAIPDDETRRYTSEEDYEKKKDKKDLFSIASQSILFRDTEKLDNHALITGVVRGVRGDFETIQGTKTAVSLELLGNVITLILDKDVYPDLEPGEVLSGIFSLYGDLT